MTATVFNLPDLGEGLTEAEILEWKVAVGDPVTVDQSVVEVETAKAAVDVPIPIAGVVARLYADAGSVVGVGAPLIEITLREGAGERYREEERAGSGNVLVGYGTSDGASRRSRRRAARPETAPVPAPVPAPVSAPAPVPAPKPGAEAPRVISPVVRRLAKEHGVDVAAIEASGPGGVVLRRDVEAAIARPEPPEETPDVVRIPLRGTRRAIAEKLVRSRSEIPDASTWVDVDATPLVELRERIGRADPDARVGTLALLARICVAGLRRYPQLNAHVDAEREEIVQSSRIHLGFAAQTGRGLVVPVVRDAQSLTLAELAAALRRRTDDAREGRLTPADLTGGTFTLNNYGVFGVDGSNPILNHPEAAMLGVGRIVDRPWAFEGEVRLRKVAQLSFTFDHRICDGGVAGGFLRFVADCVERPELLVTRL
ncbi:dihydrolipoamide acetyltransferase family protein [Actinomadura sp. NEAU-AAG7]|uniref:dihydrolipoamide acetyltransferase family protein n=1 Tax=Actinomadura sp. NEAU-AAG7 TaxID=2839640 RepID=UPI001BE46D2C|nr:dihydrolipoamide acetyltransferase family protein [Actinomadura sp. NEAU-AAG7]MBT2208284.1 2-oxo acid dehydrogenase subunit E2 [Actinomadura sp. NEAU-AAG7]